MSKTDTAATMIAGVIAVVGVLFTGTVGFVGVLLRQSLDARNLELQRGAERRLTLEAGIKALELMDESSQATTPSPKASGAILMIAELGLLETALRLANGLWTSGKVDLASAMFVIDAGLSSTDANIQRSAATLLDRHVDLIASGRREGAAPWPQTLISSWVPHVDIDARSRILIATARYLLARPRAQTQRALISMIILEYSRALEDPDKHIQAAAALCLVPLLNHFHESQGVVDSAGVQHSFEDIRAKHRELVDRGVLNLATNEFRQLAIQIDEWFQAQD